MIGLLLALCVGSYECWMMMLGRRAMDVMKLARIIALSMCITSSSWICSELQVPGKALENTTKAMAKAKNKQVAAMELKVAQKQAEYLKRLREVQDSVETAKQIQEIGQDAHWWDKLIYSMENLGSTINKYAQQAAVAAETKVSEWINDVIRFIGELIFQMTYYGILVAQRIFMTILAMFAPIMFALSIVPPWSNAWSQWISKYLSLSLWGFVTYMCLYYIDFILLYNLQEDITAYSKLLQGQVNTWSQIGALGLQGASALTACMQWVCSSVPLSYALYQRLPHGLFPVVSAPVQEVQQAQWLRLVLQVVSMAVLQAVLWFSPAVQLLQE